MNNPLNVVKIETFDHRQSDAARDSSTFSPPLSTVCEIMRLNNFAGLQLALNPASQRRVWKKKRFFESDSSSQHLPHKLQVHFQTRCPARQLSTILLQISGWMGASCFFYHSPKSPETMTFARRCCDCCCRPLSRSPAVESGAKCLCLWAPRQHFQAVWREAFRDGCRQTWAELQTLHTPHDVYYPATLCNIWVTASCEGGGGLIPVGTVCLFSCTWRETGKAEDEGNYIYYRDLSIFVYKKGNIYLHQPKCDI